MKISVTALAAITGLAIAANVAMIPTTLAQASPQRVVIIEMYGDSTTLGAQTDQDGLLTTTNNSEPNQLQDLLQSKFGAQVAVYNNGVGGTEAYQLLTGTDGRNRQWGTQVAKSRADIVIINYALNDQYYNQMPTEGYYSETPDTYAQIIGWLIQNARNAGKIVILQEPNPTCYQPTVGNLQRFVNALRSEAALMGAPLVAQYDYIQSIPNWKSMLTDCAHPNDQLYGIKAQQTFNVVAPIVQSILSR